MMHKAKAPKSFYEKRELPLPRGEWWPEDAGELRSLLVDADVPRILVGDGQHLRTPVIGARTFDAVRTERCNRVISVDRESKIVRVEAGIRWGDLQTELAERGLSLERYRLYPATATVGGLLSRFQPIHRELWDGDIRTGCVALSAISGGTDYRYLAAPRKASGPDLRWLYIGAEGLAGAILDVSLVAWAPADARLFTWKVEQFAEAAGIMNGLWDRGVRPSWSHFTSYKNSPDELAVAVHAPSRILDAVTKTLRDVSTLEFEEADTEIVAQTRAKLEAAHPDRRLLGTARRTMAGAFSTRDLVEVYASLPSFVENVTITNWTRHHAQLFVRYAKGNTLSEFPAKISARALDVRPVMDDEAVHWPHSAQTLKELLDPDHALAVGP